MRMWSQPVTDPVKILNLHQMDQHKKYTGLLLGLYFWFSLQFPDGVSSGLRLLFNCSCIDTMQTFVIYMNYLIFWSTAMASNTAHKFQEALTFMLIPISGQYFTWEKNLHLTSRVCAPETLCSLSFSQIFRLLDLLTCTSNLC